MIENWITKYNLNHLNQTEECVGAYTFSSKNGKSAIDHVELTKFPPRGRHFRVDVRSALQCRCGVAVGTRRWKSSLRVEKEEILKRKASR